jgi:soluble P-type ATPase
MLAVGTSGQLLQSNGAAAPTWTTVSSAPTITATASGSISAGAPVILNSDGLDIQVSETYGSNTNIKEDNINTVQNLFEKSTNIGICTIGWFSVMIYFHEHNLFEPFDIIDFIVDLIGCFIGLNYLIPSFKIQQSMNMWDSTYKYVCGLKNFKVCTHGNILIEFKPSDTIILSDKTGTLTKGIFTIHDYYLNPNPNYIGLIAQHINGTKFNNEYLSHCPETSVILDLLNKQHNVDIGSEHYKTDLEQEIRYIQNGQIYELTRYKKLLYRAENRGSHSICRIDKQYYHVFMGNKQQLCDLLGYLPKVCSNKRGMIIGFIKLDNLDTFDKSVKKFSDLDKLIDSYEIIAEFHFDDPFRDCAISDQTTYSGLKKLKDAGYRFYMITGDSCSTAEAIGKALGINTIVIDGAEFVKKSTEEQHLIFCDLLEKKYGIFANTRAIYKEYIVKLFKQYKKVVFLGDQENDLFALQVADLAIVQSAGNNKCKNIAHLIGEVPTEVANSYLEKERNLGIHGKAWFYKELIRFNYLTAIIWLIGIINLRFERTNLLFIDPWSALYSLIMSTIITILCLYKSIKQIHRKIQDNQIVYIEPIKALIVGFVAGLCLFVSGLNYNKYSLLVITILMLNN